MIHSKYNKLNEKNIFIMGLILCILFSIISSINYKYGVLLLLLVAITSIILLNNRYVVYFVLLFLPLHGMFVHMGLKGVAIYWKEAIVLYGCVLTFFKSLALRKIKCNFQTIIILFYTIFIILISITNYNGAITTRGMSVYILYIAFYFIVLFSIEKYSEVLRSIFFLIFSSFLVAIGGILQSYTKHSFFMNGPKEAERFNLVRASFSTGSSIVFGCFMATISIIIFAKLYFGINNYKEKLILRVVFLITCLALILSFTRVAWVQFVVSLFILILIKNLKNYKLTIFLVLCITSLIIVFVFYTNNNLLIFLKRGIYDRSSTWHQSFGIFLQRPLTGLGVGSTLWLNRNLRRDTFVTESFFLQILVETGIIGLVLFVIIIYLSITNVYKIGLNCKVEIKWLHFGILGALIGLMINMLFSQAYNGWIINMLFWYLIGLSGSLKTINN